jgi:hypothetical protein
MKHVSPSPAVKEAKAAALFDVKNTLLLAVLMAAMAVEAVM